MARLLSGTQLCAEGREKEEGPLLKKLQEANTTRKEVDSANADLEKEIRSLTKTSAECEKHLQKIESEQEWQRSLNDMMIRDQVSLLPSVCTTCSLR